MCTARKTPISTLLKCSCRSLSCCRQSRSWRPHGCCTASVSCWPCVALCSCSMAILSWPPYPSSVAATEPVDHGNREQMCVSTPRSVERRKDHPAMADMAYAAPIPQVFYIHDDLSDDVRHTYGEESVAYELTRELFTLVRRDPRRVVVLQLEDQITRLVAQGRHAPFAMTIGIGQAGERVIRQLHQRTGWFPVVRRVDVTREEDGQGGYNLVSLSAQPLATQLQGLESCASLAVVDDTVFS